MDWFGQYLRLSGKDQIVEECKKLYQQYKQLQEGGSDYHSVLPNYIVGKNKNKKKV